MKLTLMHLAAAFVLCVLTVSGYCIWYGRVAAEGAMLESLETDIIQQSTNADRATATRATLSELAGDETSMQNYFVPEANTVSFIDSLEAYGRSQKALVTVSSVSTAGAEGRSTLLLTLSISGTFDAVLRTVGAIEYAPYAISISTLSLRLDTKSEWRADLKLSVGSVSVPKP